MSRKQYSFSLIVPVYNVEVYLRKCLDSLCNQTYKGSYEIICVNDGSTDSSLAILHEYEKNDSRIRIINQENKGLGGARNTGVKFAQGDYIWFIDSDDWIELESLETLDKEIVLNNADVILFDIKRVSNNETKVIKNFNSYSLNNISYEDYVKLLLQEKARYFSVSKIFKKELFLNSKFSFPDGWYEDVSLIKLYVDTAPSISIIYTPLYNYLKREGSIMNTYDERILTLMSRYKDISSHIAGRKEYKDDLVAFYFSCVLAIILRTKNIKDKRIRLNMITKLIESKEFKHNWKQVPFNQSITLRRKLKIFMIRFSFAYKYLI